MTQRRSFQDQIRKSKLKSVFLVVVIFILVFSFGAYAAGGGGGGGGGGQRVVAVESVLREPVLVDCEERTSRAERIGCRLENVGNMEFAQISQTPEACRGLDKSEICVNFYTIIQECYELDGREKARCFKSKSEISEDRLEIVRDKDKIRLYLVALLYELEERIEFSYYVGTLESSDSSKLIDMIIDVKRDILSGNPREEIRAKMQNLKTEWRILKG